MYFWSSPWVSIMQSGLRLWPSHPCAIPQGTGAGAPQGTGHFLRDHGPCSSGHGSSPQHTLEPPDNSYVKTLPLGSFRPLFPDSLPLCWGTSDYWWDTLALLSGDSSYWSHLLGVLTTWLPSSSHWGWLPNFHPHPRPLSWTQGLEIQLATRHFPLDIS